MTQEELFLLVVAVAGMYGVRWSLRLAPLYTELPLKTVAATLLSALVSLAGVLPFEPGEALRLFILVAGPAFVFGPLLAVGLARARRYSVARVLGRLLYWTPEGRGALERLLAQVALQQGDVAAARRLVPDGDALMQAQLLALEESWSEILELDLPEVGDNAFLGRSAKVQALLALGRVDEAARAVDEMRSRWEAVGGGAIGHRSVRLGELRLAAERGELDAVRKGLAEPLPNVPPYVLFAILARAAERTGRFDEAARLYGQAYALAPEGLKDRYARSVEALGHPLPERATGRPRPIGTYALAVCLALAFVGQLTLDEVVGAIGILGGRFEPSSAVAAFLLNVPGVPQGEAWWRGLSYALVHANLLHVGFNLWVLVDIGRLYEARRGWGNLLASFALGTYLGAYITASAQAASAVVLVGASGGVLGVAGALLADVIRSRTPADRLLTRSLLQWMGLIALLSVAIPQVSLWGHVGGVVGGLLWGFARQGLPRGRRLDGLFGVVSVGLLLWAGGSAALLALRLFA